ncbi:uncharacterized protein LOC132714378 [Ruditapes philippinarum]|uniref:uncharacterized protein LOC132714378 n=1 Tax=Ruditapes philippinarum TaxID=129788 RepID=UPI00295BD51F|nr:uncharacterized protein LOC132714378 [Ruditapes philippinarum]
MDSAKVLITFAILSCYIAAVEGCGRTLRCYRCNSLDSPATCGERNFNADAHKGDIISGNDFFMSCTHGYTETDKGALYYYRSTSTRHLDDGLVGRRWACNEDLCNESTGMFIASNFLFCYLMSVIALIMVV